MALNEYKLKVEMKLTIYRLLSHYGIIAQIPSQEVQLEEVVLLQLLSSLQA